MGISRKMIEGTFEALPPGDYEVEFQDCENIKGTDKNGKPYEQMKLSVEIASPESQAGKKMKFWLFYGKQVLQMLKSVAADKKIDPDKYLDQIFKDSEEIDPPVLFAEIKGRFFLCRIGVKKDQNGVDRNALVEVLPNNNNLKNEDV